MAGTQVQLRRGTTAQHSAFTGAVGEVTVDTDKHSLVVHDGATAGGFPVRGGATGAGSNAAFYENDTTITADYTITTNKNAMTAGPITINNGVTVQIPSGSVWTIV